MKIRKKRAGGNVARVVIILNHAFILLLKNKANQLLSPISEVFLESLYESGKRHFTMRGKHFRLEALQAWRLL